MNPAHEIECQRALFELDPTEHYLNCAYMAPLAAPVERAGIAGMQRRRRPSSIRPEDFFAPSDAVRSAFARLIHAPDAQRVAILPSVSYGMAIAARHLAPQAGQNIVIAAEQFPSNVYAWREMAQRNAGTVHAVSPPPTNQDRTQAWNAALLEAINERTAVVALSHTHWVDGTRFDLEAISKRARSCGAALIIDGTQSVGALPFDVTQFQPDAVICASYKWMFGPYGLAYGWFGPRFDQADPLEWNWIARAGSEDFRTLIQYRDELQAGAARFDVGERSDFIRLPMALAALDLVLSWGAERIQHYCAELMHTALEEAQSLGFTCENASGRGAHLIGLRARQPLDPARVQQAFAAERVLVSLRGDCMRIAPHVYNDHRDVEGLMRALRRLR